MKLNCYNSFLFLLFLMVNTLSCEQEKSKDQLMIDLIKEFTLVYPSFDIPPLQLSYKDNLSRIQPIAALEEQALFFEKIHTQLKGLPIEELDPELSVDHEVLSFITQLNLERIQLSYDFIKEKDKRPIDWENGLYFIPYGKDWYRYFTKAWLGAEVEPRQLTNFGMAELEEVQEAIYILQEELGYKKNTVAFYEYLNKERFQENDPNKIKRLFKERSSVVRKRLWEQFYEWDLPEEDIKQGNSKALSQVPGYYEDNEQTFFFNLFDKPFITRQLDFLYLHEAVPGHHFQMSLEKTLKSSIPEYRKMFYANGYREGWAAYVEEIGEDFGLYRTPYDLIGKHEWDIVRCARVVMDVGINYRGWSDEKALSFWKTNIDNQDDIAMREIKRMRRWPAQVHTYKYGAEQILQLREKAQAELGSSFDIRAFHAKILNGGPLPWKAIK